MALNLTKTKLSISIGVAICTLHAPIANAATFLMEKNGTSFSIDGNKGAIEGQQLYVWSSDSDNENQQWVQISHGDGYYSYKKYGTSLCWDGGDGGAKRQAVTLEVCDSTDYNQHWNKVKVYSGTEIYRFEKRNASGFSIDGNNEGDDGQLMYLWTSDSDNVNQQWELTNTSTTSTDYDLDASVTPSGNFDLQDWYLSIPVDEGDGYATSIKENELSASYEDEFFYTGTDGGMVFVTPIDGVKTSGTTKYTRTELREMLRRGDTSIDTSYDVDEDEDGNGRLNNWAFSSISSSDQDEFGGIDGVMTATLAINHVTTTSNNNEQVGRIVIGQIHAKSNEPIRLYYHKLPGNDNGAIYFAHETSKSDGGNETWYNLLGSMVDSDGALSSTSNPSDGIALNEAFSYNITVNGDSMQVTISQDGTQLATQPVDMSDSRYNDADNSMYFKAGIYLQDCDDEEDSCDSDSDDYAQATFYELSNTHDNYDY
ncbi:MAG: hypothetical protein ACJAT7_002725 [Psychromonas sp.]|jgi:hypothetical protein|uniref:polysaccharide lyase family 7 protein n=1 Tax=Psychromonas sp. TaxID=1884585 RepID=UPI0039E6D29C